MVLIGVGVDVVHIPRIASLFQRRGSRVASRILSAEERAQWELLPTSDLGRRVRFLAVRWGIKEAAYKAMYPVVRPTWKELTYRGLGDDPARTKPTLVYHPADASCCSKVGKTHISVSHDGDYVFTSVIVEKPANVP
ncbi:Holo-[acyl-carrier-protein] synthase [Hypsizygus marmoreus]|uniref:Holo-[acyl-carrier-protein] synthase n=1 Tax=Hypsizygus marmoreus TaxID=39966 RepID=A0A369JMK9_HYPMA|nr:Holo-[acyl-carrier-protein] synthase [Hypsizygus marmoreus]